MNDEKLSQAITHLVKVDTTMAKIVPLVGPIRVPRRQPNFKGLVRIIINQQLSGKAASTIFSRAENCLDGGRFTPKNFSLIGEERLRGVGVSTAKARYILKLSNMLESDPQFVSRLKHCSDEDAYNQLISIKGIGDWSARVFLMFYLSRANVFAAGDKSIETAISSLYSRDHYFDEDVRNSLLALWSPHISTACVVLWRWIDSGRPTA